MENQSLSSPHVLIFPLPAQGHITPMLNLAELLCLSNFQVTFLITTQTLQRLTQYTDTETRFSRYAGFRFKAILDGPPAKLLSSHYHLKDSIVDMVQGLAVNAKPLLEEMLYGFTHTILESSVTCLVVDGWLSFAYDVANDAGVPVISFRCPSACCVWGYFCTPKLIEAGEVPFQGMEHQASSPPHVVIIPHPIQGHVTPILHLAELLCLANMNITLLSSTFVHQHLNESSNIEDRLARLPGFRFEAVPDGLPDDHPRTGKDGSWAVLQGFASSAEPRLREISIDTSVTCLIVDGRMGFAHDVAKEANIPVIAFRCYSACYHWLSSCIPQLIDDECIPFKDEDLDELVQNVPGMDTFLRYRDLPSFCRTKDKPSCLGIQHTFAAEIQRTSQAYGLILNTFEDLEGPILSLLRSQCSRIYSIGPLHALLKHRLTQEKTTLTNPSSSLWEVDQSCLSWLDQKPTKSVVYVGFGSLTVLERDQLMEIWEGLVQCKKFFLWVIRPNLIISSDNDFPTSAALLEGTKERGCIVSWAPQEAVLAHRAIGGFLTHSGWNSTLESITAGVPMICWPYFADQQVNSRYVGEVWRIGLDMKDKCDRNVVAEMVNDLLDGKKDEVERSMARMSNAAKKSVTEGGSSYCNLDSLIQDIKMMSMKGEH